MRESAIEGAVRDYAVSLGVYTRKFASPAHRGVPDRLFVCNGTTLYLEFKQPGKKPTPLQYKELETLAKHGACAAWTDSKDAGRTAIRCLLGLDSIVFPEWLANNTSADHKLVIL